MRRSVTAKTARRTVTRRQDSVSLDVRMDGMGTIAKVKVKSLLLKYLSCGIKVAFQHELELHCCGSAASALFFVCKLKFYNFLSAKRCCSF